jgi:hypothetical protein
MSEAHQLQTEIEEIEISIEEGRKKVKEMEDLLTLTDNPIFSRLIIKGYFEDYALNCLRMSTSVAIDDRTRKQVEIDMHGPSALRRYLDGIIQQGIAAKNAISVGEDQIQTLQEEMDPFEAAEEGDDA